MAHGVNGGDVVGPDVTVVDGGLWIWIPEGFLPVWVGTDLRQQLQLHRLILVVPPGDGFISAHSTKTFCNGKHFATKTSFLLEKFKLSITVCPFFSRDLVSSENKCHEEAT